MERGFFRGLAFAGALLMGLLFLAGTVWPQVTASITGTVQDSSGAVVPDATVSVKHIETGATRTVEADTSGSYTVASLPIGQYEVNAENPGYGARQPAYGYRGGRNSNRKFRIIRTIQGGRDAFEPK